MNFRLTPDNYFSAKFDVVYYNTMAESAKEIGGKIFFSKPREDHMPDDDAISKIVADINKFMEEGPLKMVD